MKAVYMFKVYLWRSHPSFIGLINWTWLRHQMETSSALLAVCAGNSPVPVNSPHKGPWRGALMFSLICVWINGWANNRKAGDLRRYRAHYDVIVMRQHTIRPMKYTRGYVVFKFGVVLSVIRGVFLLNEKSYSTPCYAILYQFMLSFLTHHECMTFEMTYIDYRWYESYRKNTPRQAVVIEFEYEYILYILSRVNLI